jgi:hypothetical protein
MYYPYLRGRQYELIALRELVEKSLIGDKLLPIIEPVRTSPTFLSFMDTFSENKQKFGIIINPEYGHFNSEIDSNSVYKNEYNLRKYRVHCLPTYILNSTIRQQEPMDSKDAAIAICKSKDMISSINRFTDVLKLKTFIMPDERIYKRGVHGNKVLLSDNFNKKQRNVDYIKEPDEFFSDDHLYFAEEGYVGYSDFSIIGDDYSESGFAPYAVAIHMVYFDKNKNLRIHHFISDTNDDYADPAGKFFEALKKLIEFPSLRNQQTFAYSEYVRFYNNHIYSGLGIVKKLSLMHHFELMNRFFSEKEIL